MYVIEAQMRTTNPILIQREPSILSGILGEAAQDDCVSTTVKMLLRFLRISLHNSCFPVRGNHFLFNYVMIFTLKRGLWRLTGPMMKFSQLSIHDGDQVLRSYAHCITSNQTQSVLSCFRMKVKSENFLQF